MKSNMGSDGGDIKPASRRGGKRPGAGRKPKGHVSLSKVDGLDLASALQSPPPDEIETVAQQHARTAIDALVKQLRFGNSDAAKVAAANAILDRGFGKPTVDLGGDAMLPFAPTPSAPTLAGEIRTEARKYAHLAIAVLKKVAESGQSESARVSASKSLLDRGLGTVAQARMPDEFNQAPIGKREQAARAAEAAASGRYATPSPPRSPATIQ
jgi:hypothetical protein